MVKKFSDWFDPYNKEHLMAYKHLEKTGCWPMKFIVESELCNKLDMDYYWIRKILEKMAQAWINYFLEEKPLTEGD